MGCLLSLLGFGSLGILKGSIAACFQSCIGVIAAGSIFALFQSRGMRG